MPLQFQRLFSISPSKLFSSLLLICLIVLCPNGDALGDTLQIDLLWRYHAPSGSCEICSFDEQSGNTITTVGGGIDILSSVSGVRGSALEQPTGFHATSVACSLGRVAVAWAATDKQERGKITIYDSSSFAKLATFPAGYLPDMVTFSPNGRYLLAANEGEPTDNYAFDPPGSITLIDLKDGLYSAQVIEVGFQKFDSGRSDLRRRGVRLCGPSKTHEDGQATVSEDLEPEYIAMAPDSRKAWVTLQENNAVAELDIELGVVTNLHSFGFKDFGQLTNPQASTETTGIDTSDSDGGCRIRHHPVKGLFQPDTINCFTRMGKTYLVTANEGDPRDYDGYCEAVPAAQLGRDKRVFDRASAVNGLLQDDQLGRLEVSAVTGDKDNDGDIDELHCFGARSFAVWEVGEGELHLVYESGNDFEQITFREAPHRFNANSKPDSQPDVRSISRGPEPEGIAIGRVGTRYVAMIGLERTGGVMIYDITDPTSPKFIQYLPPLVKDGVMDCAPEGLLFIPADQSPTDKALLVICNEKSGTTTAFELAWKTGESD